MNFFSDSFDSFSMVINWVLWIVSIFAIDKMNSMKKLKITELNRISIEEFKVAEKLPLIVVLDDIRSLHNIGSVFRTSDA